MVYLNKNREIDVEEWREIISKLGLPQKIKSAKSIIIKPNFAAGTYVDSKSHVISDLLLLRSCISFLANENSSAIIYIAEADSTGNGFAYQKFEHLQLPNSLELPQEICSRVHLLDLSRDRLVACENNRMKWFNSIDRKLYLSETLMKSEFRISMSNLKTHAVTGYTGACKNLFGCLPDFDKSIYHPQISKVVHDMVISIHPDLNIVDAFYGMEGNGPVQGKDVDTGYRVFSNNAVEADIYACKTIGYVANNIGYLKLLCKTLDVAPISEADVIKKYKRPRVFLRSMNYIGLSIQRIGQRIALLGHRIHGCTNLIDLGIVVMRPLLLKLFDYEKLKEWKRKILK